MTDSKLLAAAKHAEAVMTIFVPRSDMKEYRETLYELRAAIALTHPGAQGNKDGGEPALRALVVTPQMCERALVAVCNLKRSRYRLPSMTLDTLKVSEGPHWALLMEETWTALQAALAAAPPTTDEELAGCGGLK